jgi:hypothetical protein
MEKTVAQSREAARGSKKDASARAGDITPYTWQNRRRWIADFFFSIW